MHAASHDCDFFVQDGTTGVVDKEAANDLHPCQGEVKHVSHNDDEVIVKVVSKHFSRSRKATYGGYRLPISTRKWGTMCNEGGGLGPQDMIMTWRCVLLWGMKPA